MRTHSTLGAREQIGFFNFTLSFQNDASNSRSDWPMLWERRFHWPGAPTNWYLFEIPSYHVMVFSGQSIGILIMVIEKIMSGCTFSIQCNLFKDHKHWWNDNFIMIGYPTDSHPF